MRVKHSKTAYVVVGYGWMRFILNDEDKVEEMHVNWRLTSLKVRIAWLISTPPFSSPRHPSCACFSLSLLQPLSPDVLQDPDGNGDLGGGAGAIP